MLTANANVLENEIVHSLDGHPQHQLSVLLVLAVHLRQAKRYVVDQFSHYDVLAGEGLDEVFAPAQRDHYPAEAVEDVHLVLQVVEEDHRYVNVRLLVEHLGVEDAVGANHAH